MYDLTNGVFEILVSFTSYEKVLADVSKEFNHVLIYSKKKLIYPLFLLVNVL